MLFVGTYTARGSEGIYSYRVDPDTGALTLAAVTGGVANPSFLAVDVPRRRLFAVQETGPEGAVFAYHIDAQTGELTPVNQQPSHGAAPCHLSVDSGGRCVLVANYSTGSACVLPVGQDGQLLEASAVVQHAGSGPRTDRQEGPHAHSITLDPHERFALVADLGLDRVMVYAFHAGRGTLTPHAPPWAQVHPAAGPRHLAFHPSGRYVYVINELDSTLTAFAYDAGEGILTPLQTAPTLPGHFDGHSTCADVHVSPSGRFLYGSNRGHDSLVIYAIDASTGLLAYVGHEPTQGRNPRNFAFDPTGRFLLAANQDSDTLVTFRLDPETGKLSPTGHVTHVSMPVCLKFAVFPDE
ncbi:MAG: lactonase family protein [Armatimonadetes bacterium]|nr:lactonase family protein [Armatimonadota bacterium]